MLRRVSSFTAKSAARAVSAMYVRLGFTQLADAELRDRTRPPLAARAPLVAEAAQVRALVAEQVAEARDVEARRPVAEVVLVVEPVEQRVGAEPEVVVHQVVPELSGATA